MNQLTRVVRLRAGLAIFLMLVTAGLVAQQPRDGQRALPRAGTAVLTGVVLSAGTPARPIRRATVTLRNPTLPFGLAAITDDDGRFRIERVPAGRYSVEAAKESYIPNAYGANRPGRPGQQIALADGRAHEIAFRLQRGGVLSGTLTDHDGQPLSGTLVTAFRFGYNPRSGERVPLTPTGSTTDDRGEYRIFGLLPGDYVIYALPSDQVSGSLQVQSAEEVRRALAEIAANNPGVARVPGPPPSPRVTTLPPGPAPRTVSFAPVFYPGSARAADAWVTTLNPEEERQGLDFQAQHVPTAAVSGVVVGPGGPLQGASVVLAAPGWSETSPDSFQRTAGSDGQGKFTFSRVPPGTYTLTAHKHQLHGGSGHGAGAGGWASMTLTIDGDDVTDLALALQPGLSISGRVVFDGERPFPAGLPAGRAYLPIQMAAGPPVQPPLLEVTDDGRFVARDVVPGVWRPWPSFRGLRNPLGGWWLQSVLIGDRELLDGPLELRQSSNDAVVTFADRASELSGVVTDGRGQPVTDHYVVIFSANPAHWFPLSRRIEGIRLPQTGRYVIRNLPPGDYLLVVDDDVDPGQWFDRSYLARTAAGASRITLGAFETKFRDIVLPGR